MTNNAKRLKDLLKKKGLSLNDCSRTLEIDKFSLWRYTAGEREPSEEVRKKMKQKLGFEWRD